MNVQLVPVSVEEVDELWEMQKEIFKESYEKYGYESDPGNQSLLEVELEFRENNIDVYKICLDDKWIGMVWTLETSESRWLYKMGVNSEYSGKGIAQEAIVLLEEKYPDTPYWELNVISEEKGAQHIYEKLGYEKTGYEEFFEKGARLIFYDKNNTKSNIGFGGL